MDYELWKLGTSKTLKLVELLNLTFEQETRRNRHSNVKFAPSASTRIKTRVVDAEGLLRSYRFSSSE